jgi:hypothetical protein
MWEEGQEWKDELCGGFGCVGLREQGIPKQDGS